MALRGTGATTLTFAAAPQAAQYAVSTVVTDSAPNPYVLGWTQQLMPVSAAWSSVVYGNGLWVAVASGGTVAATSPDGITWTQRTLPVSAAWSRVGYGNGMFVALVSGTTIAASSPDGITWTQRTLPVAVNWNAVAYGNGVFAALGGTGTIAATSPDGITWTQRALPVSASWTSIAYGNGTFVAVAGGPAGGSTIAATAPDGVTWTQRTLPQKWTWSSIAYGNGIFVAVEQDGSGIVAKSVDGITWGTQAITSVPKHIIAYNGTAFVVYSASNYLLQLRNGTNAFEFVSFPTIGSISCLAGGSPDNSFRGSVGFVAIAPGTAFAITSVDGMGSLLPNTRTTSTVNTLLTPAYPVPGSLDAKVTITGLIDMTSNGSASALLMASDSSADHNASEHGMVDVALRCADFVAGVGFTIYASSPQRLDGAFTVRYAWSA